MTFERKKPEVIPIQPDRHNWQLSSLPRSRDTGMSLGIGPPLRRLRVMGLRSLEPSLTTALMLSARRRILARRSM